MNMLKYVPKYMIVVKDKIEANWDSDFEYEQEGLDNVWCMWAKDLKHVQKLIIEYNRSGRTYTTYKISAKKISIKKQSLPKVIY